MLIFVIFVICSVLSYMGVPNWGIALTAIVSSWVVMGFLPESPSAKIFSWAWRILAIFLTLTAINEAFNGKKDD